MNRNNTDSREIGINVGETGADRADWKYGLAWERSYEIGSVKIDEQHKELFRLTSDLIEATEKGRAEDVLSDALDFLARYTVQHFADEEALQLASGYPNYEEHKKMHDEFTASVITFIEAFRAGERDGLTEKIRALVARWLVNHVKNVDSVISKYINEK